jgi:zinc D-Ala-D-Ala dipeptidase
MKKTTAFLILLFSFPTYSQQTGLTCIDSFPALTFDIRYASTNNFSGKNIYGDRKTSYLHPIAAERLQRASILLEAIKPGWKIVVFDALRPHSAQKALWDVVQATPQRKYVASPNGTSVHNYGFAIDVTLEDEFGRRLDMGTDYDDFSQLSEPRFEDAMLHAGKLSAVQVANRRFLRDIMKRAGWRTIKNEWWHFEVFRREYVKGRFKLIE